MEDYQKGERSMSDELLSYEEAEDLAREMLDELIDEDPDAARSLLLIGSSAPLVIPDGLLRRFARVGMLTRAVEVRCDRECDHFDRPRYAWLRFGILTCAECLREGVWADVKPREDANLDCDVCGADADPFYDVRHRLVGDQVMMVLARTCPGCGELHNSLVIPKGPGQVSLN
jgi:hypothetical protein